MEGARYLEDGRLTIFKRSGVFYARIRLSASGKYIWRSLKTSEEQTAIRGGRRLLFHLEQRTEQGLPSKSKLFAAVIDDYIRHRERDHQHGRTSHGMLRQIIRVSKFWREYAGELRVETIDDKVMREFIPWRRDYYSSFKTLPKNARLHPTDKTLQWDMMLGKAVVKWAHEQGFRGTQSLPTATFTPKKKRVRPAFEIPEYKRLWRTLSPPLVSSNVLFFKNKSFCSQSKSPNQSPKRLLKLYRRNGLRLQPKIVYLGWGLGNED